MTVININNVTPAKDLLTRKQRKFVNYYLECNNASEAALKAGYSSNNVNKQASQILNKPLIQSELDKHRQIAVKASEVTFDWKIKVLKTISERCLSSEPMQAANAVKAIEVLNAMQGHNAEQKSLHINIDTTIERLQQARLQYKDA